jgi:hypothetical protein
MEWCGLRGWVEGDESVIINLFQRTHSLHTHDRIVANGWVSKWTGLPYGRSGDKLRRKAATKRVGMATIR